MNSTSNNLAQSQRWLLSIAVVFTIIWLATLGTRKLLNPDEGRYAEIPREMVASGDWVTPRLNDLKYFEKPALQYWMTAIAYESFGINEFTSRLWCGLTGLLTVVFIGWLGTRLFDFNTGVIAAALLASSLMHVILGHLNTLDMGLSFFLTVAIGAFLSAQRAPQNSQAERNFMWLAYAAAAGALLSKGIVALVLPALALIVYSIVAREFSAWRRLHLLGGLSLLALICAPWFIVVSIANPEFAHFFFVHEHLQRFLTDVHERVEPWWYFIPLLIVGALPWISMAAPALIAAWRHDATMPAASSAFKPRQFLIVWCAVVMLFFSYSHSKLAPYILPIMPALALLTADWLARARAKTVRWHLIGVALLWSLALAYLLFGALPTKRGVSPDIFATLFRWAEMGAVAAIVGAIVGGLLLRRDRVRDALVSMALGTFVGLSILLVGFDAAREVRSGYDLAEQIKAHHSVDKPFYSLFDYDQSLPFYLGRTMTLVGYRGELDFGLNQEPAKGLPDAQAFELRWRNDPPGSQAVMPHATYTELAAAGLPMQRIGSNHELIAVTKP